MNKEYIKEIYDNNKEKLIESEYEIKSPEDLKTFMESNLIANMQYDFHIYPDGDKLFNERKENSKGIEIEINNNGKLRLMQNENDKLRGGIGLEYINDNNEIVRRDLIDEGDFVMLMNYYIYIKDYDIKDDFINRDGTNNRNNLENDNEINM